MENFHPSRNAVATMHVSFLLFASLGTSAIVTQPVIPITRVKDVAPALALITPAPAVDYQAIFARDKIATCGYISGKAASPLTCPQSYMCTSTMFGAGWGCCDQIQCKGNYHVCVDYGGNQCPGLDDDTCSSIYTSILKCSSADPSCIKYARSKSVGDFTTEFSLGCGKSSETILALITPVSGQGGDNAAATSSPGGSAQATNSPSNADGGNSNNSSNKSNKLSVGEIAGIVSPIVGVIVAVVIGWWKRHQVVWCFTCGARGHKNSRIDGGGNRLKPIPPKYNGDYRPVNPQPEFGPTPYHSNQSFPVYNQPYPQSYQASNPNISTQWRVYNGN